MSKKCHYSFAFNFARCWPFDQFLPRDMTLLQYMMWPHLSVHPLWPIEWHKYQRPWVTLKVLLLLETKMLKERWDLNYQLLRIHCWVCGRMNFRNQSAFSKVRVKHLVAPFFQMVWITSHKWFSFKESGVVVTNFEQLLQEFNIIWKF